MFAIVCWSIMQVYFAEKVILEMFSIIKTQLMKDIHPDRDSLKLGLHFLYAYKSSLKVENWIYCRYFFTSLLVPYSGNFSRTINFSVFVDFTATSKINPRKSYCTVAYKCNDSQVDPRNLFCEMFWGRSTSKTFVLEIFPLYGIWFV